MYNFGNSQVEVIYFKYNFENNIFKLTKSKVSEIKNMYIPRLISNQVLEVQKYYPVTVITGPRQSGKSMLCKHLFPDYKYVNLENINTRAFAATDPEAFINSLGETAVIDEVQRIPDILSVIQVKVDENKERRYILTGSNNLKLTNGISQSLAGRAALFTLLPFSFPELDSEKLKDTETSELIFQGQYPGVIADNIPPVIFFINYVSTYIEKDINELLKVKNTLKFESFLRLMAARCGSEFNAASISKEVGVSATTISEWLSILAASYIIYTVRPYYTNINKRLTKMPKVYFYDTGLMAYLLGIESPQQITSSPFRGSLFENLAMGELIKSRLNKGLKPEITFYREHSGKEVDALMPADGIHLFEIKASSTFNKEFISNIDYVRSLIPEVSGYSVIYDGENIPPNLINIRNI